MYVYDMHAVQLNDCFRGNEMTSQQLICARLLIEFMSLGCNRSAPAAAVYLLVLQEKERLCQVYLLRYQP